MNLVSVNELTDQHLRAEFVETKMLIHAFFRSINSKNGIVEERISKTYTLNKGHVYFFYNKMGFLKERYDKIITELKARNVNIDPTKLADFSNVPINRLNNYFPTEDEIAISKKRIDQRISLKPEWYRYYGTPLVVIEKTIKMCILCGKKPQSLKVKTENKGKCKPCIQTVKLTHGHRTNGRRDKLYVKWIQMRQSVSNPNFKDYKYVGAVGIKIAPLFDTYIGFRNWVVGNKFYKEGMMLKRIDVSKDFTPDNIKFFIGRVNKLFEYNEQKFSSAQLKQKLTSRVPKQRFADRVWRGWSIQRAALQPIGLKVRKSKKIVLEAENENIKTI